MSRSIFVLGTITTLVAGACSGGEVAVTVAIDVPDPEQEGVVRSQPLDGVEVQLLPFDRDAVFDSLASAASAPEPAIPPDVLEAQDSISASFERWQALETRWGTLRDTLTAINEIMQDYSPAEARYSQLFSLYNNFDDEYARVDAQKSRAFARYDSVSQANIARGREIRIQQENWAADAFADVDVVFLAKSREAGREVQADTTDLAEAGGAVTFRGLKSGTWWVTARYALPITELYWNVPVEVGGDPASVVLNRENAEERPLL